MASFSKVILMGNVTRDPEIRAFPSGSSLAGFGVGISRKYKGSDGNLVDDPTFVDIKFFGKQAEVCEKYVHKGDSIVIEGRLKLESWEKDGQKKSKLVVIGEKLHLMPKKEIKADNTSAEVVSDESIDGYEPTVKPSKKKKDDEVPF